MTPLGLIVGAVGLAALYAALRGESLRDAVVRTFAPSSPAGQAAAHAKSGPGRSLVLDSSSATSSSADSSTTSSSSSTGTAPAVLVPIDTGGHQLAPGAAAAFKRAESILGRNIAVTDAYRSYATQAAAYARDSHRFAPPGSSAHVTGNAVDIVEMTSGPVRQALLAAGWCQSRPSDEPWHYSFGGCK